MSTLLQPLIDKLQSIHDRLIPLEIPSSFFLTLYEYLEVYDQDPRLETLIKAVRDQKDKDFKRSKELEEKAAKEMKHVYSKIHKHLQENGLNNQDINRSLTEYEGYVRDDGTIESSAGSLVGQHSSLLRTLISLGKLADMKEKIFVSEFGQFETESCLMYDFNISPSYIEWEREQKYIKRMQRTKLWHDVERLGSFYLLYRDYEKWRQQEASKKHLLNVMNLDLSFQELQSTMSYKINPKRYLLDFDVPTYKNHLERLHTHIKEALQIADQENKDLVKKHGWLYDSTTGVFVIDGKVVQLKKDGLRAKILELLSKNERNKKKCWSNDAIYEQVEGVDEADKDDIRKVYDAAKRLSEHIASKTGITKFLLPTTNTTQINPEYLE